MNDVLRCLLSPHMLFHTHCTSTQVIAISSKINPILVTQIISLKFQNKIWFVVTETQIQKAETVTNPMAHFPFNDISSCISCLNIKIDSVDKTKKQSRFFKHLSIHGKLVTLCVKLNFNIIFLETRKRTQNNST